MNTLKANPALLIIFLLFSELNFAQETAARKPIEQVKTVSFMLTGGQNITGKVIFEDRNTITVAEIDNAKITNNQYQRIAIEKRTITYQNISELEYYQQLGQRFLEKTWDFNNDADEFAQAMRCFKSAKQILIDFAGEEHTLVKQMQEKIDDANEQQNQWIEQAKRRAQMSQLEFAANWEDNLNELKQMITNNAEAISITTAKLSETIQEMDNITELKTQLEEIAEDLKKLRTSVEQNTREINNLYSRTSSTRYINPPRIIRYNKSDSNSN